MVTATNVFVEVAENVLIGEVTQSSPVRINGVSIALLADPRLAAGPVTNDFGFVVVPTTAPAGSLASAEGSQQSGEQHLPGQGAGSVPAGADQAVAVGEVAIQQ